MKWFFVVFFGFQEFRPNSDLKSSNGSVPRRSNLSTQVRPRAPVGRRESSSPRLPSAPTSSVSAAFTEPRTRGTDFTPKPGKKLAVLPESPFWLFLRVPLICLIFSFFIFGIPCNSRSGKQRKAQSSGPLQLVFLHPKPSSRYVQHRRPPEIDSPLTTVAGRLARFQSTELVDRELRNERRLGRAGLDLSWL